MNEKILRIAIPMAAGKLAQHFGHCEKFVLYDVDKENKDIMDTIIVAPPPHEPGILPPWLAQQGVNLIITGGIGQHALRLFAAQKIDILTGVLSEEPRKVVMSYLEGNIESGMNTCNHGENSCGH